MPVANAQVDQLLAVLGRHVPAGRIQHLLVDLRETAAYETNKSFRETVDRLLLRNRELNV